MNSKHIARMSVIENLEGRTFLSSAGSPVAGFGTGGRLDGYAVLAAQNDGSLIAENNQNQLVLLHPDGTFESNYTGSKPSTVPVQNVQSDGKYLIINNGKLTRYNKNGTVDKTFGTNGTVSNFFVAQQGVDSATFNLQAVAVDGTKIFVSGTCDFSVGDGTVDQVFVEKLTSSGKIDTTFGNHGVATEYSPTQLGDFVSLQVFFMEIGPDHNIYIANEFDDNPVVDRYSEAGKFQNEAFQSENADFPTVGGIVFQHDGKILILTEAFDYGLNLARYNADLSVDTSFGNAGNVYTEFHSGEFYALSTPVALSQRADGAIFLSGYFVADINGVTGYKTFAYTSKATGAAISGHFFNDTNGNGKLDTGEQPLRYWAAYIDTNNNGVWDPGEEMAYADYNGYYKFSDLAPGTYIIREVRQDGWTRTSPSGSWPVGGDYKVTLTANQLVGLRDFGNHQ